MQFFLLSILAHFYASHPLCNQEGLQRSLPTLLHTRLFSQLFLLPNFFLLWTLYIKVPTLSLYKTYSLYTSSHVTNSSQVCSHGSSQPPRVPKTDNRFQFLQEAPPILTKKSVLACQNYFWHMIWIPNLLVHFVYAF